MCNPLEYRSFANIGKPRTVWTIPAIHGDLDALTRIHDHLIGKIRPGDRILYHGNYTGYSIQSAACIDEILAFRRLVLAMPGMAAHDFIYLRGQQEQIWQKFMQLPFAPEPKDVLIWMLGNGLSATLQSYGFCPHDGIEACRSGTVGLTRWLNNIRETVRKNAGHVIFMNQQQRAAFTDENAPYPILFIHAGLDANKSLHEQGDGLWWSTDEFDSVETAYKPFEKVVRGYDPRHRGLYLNCITASVDDGCGFGGKLVSVGFDNEGGVDDILEA